MSPRSRDGRRLWFYISGNIPASGALRSSPTFLRRKTRIPLTEAGGICKTSSGWRRELLPLDTIQLRSTV